MAMDPLGELKDKKTIPSLIQALHAEDIHESGWVLSVLYKLE